MNLPYEVFMGFLDDFKALPNDDEAPEDAKKWEEFHARFDQVCLQHRVDSYTEFIHLQDVYGESTKQPRPQFPKASLPVGTLEFSI